MSFRKKLLVGVIAVLVLIALVALSSFAPVEEETRTQLNIVIMAVICLMGLFVQSRWFRASLKVVWARLKSLFESH